MEEGDSFNDQWQGDDNIENSNENNTNALGESVDQKLRMADQEEIRAGGVEETLDRPAPTPPPPVLRYCMYILLFNATTYLYFIY